MAEQLGTARAVQHTALILAIYCYFAGWVYTYHLFSHFGLTLSAIDIPVYYFFMYSYFALPTSIPAKVAVGAVILVLLFTVCHLSER